MCHGGRPTITLLPPSSSTWLCRFPVGIELQLLVRLELVGRLQGRIVAFAHVEYLRHLNLRTYEIVR